MRKNGRVNQIEFFFWAGMYFATNVMYPMLSGCWEVQRVIDNLIGPYHILEWAQDI